MLTASEIKAPTWNLKVTDRCDSCGAQAFVMVKGISGELLFCSHHYDAIMNSTRGNERMMSFMLEVVDERERLIENRLVGEN